MTAGHFALAAVVKSRAPRVPLWALMLSTYLLDVIFIILVGFGLEGFAPIDPAKPGYGQVLIHAEYTHSLVGAGFIALIAGLLASRAWGKDAGLVIGAMVMSHWALDLLVHRPDLPILPGNLWNLPVLGFGLWQIPAVSAILELSLSILGAGLYFRSAARKAAPAHGSQARLLLATGLTSLFIFLLLAVDLLNFPVYFSLGLMLLLIVLCGWLDSRLNWTAPATKVRSGVGA